MERSADGVVPTRSAVYFMASSLSRPADIYKWTISGTTRVTHDNDALLGSIRMGATSDYWYTGAENAQIQALIVKPPNFDAAKKYPTMVLIHGGPQGNWADSWGYRWNPQMWAARARLAVGPQPAERALY